MAGIYIHIPFCKKACHYCNFHFSTQTQHIQAFTHALVEEIKLQKNYLNEPIETLYFGGGTPSLLKKPELEIIIQAIKNHFKKPIKTTIFLLQTIMFQCKKTSFSS